MSVMCSRDFGCEFIADTLEEIEEHEKSHGPLPEFEVVTTKTWSGYKHTYIKKGK